MAEKKTFEGALSRLEEIAAQLESGELTLDQSLKLYEESSKLAAFCSQKLESAKIKLSELDNNTEDAQ
ncbi:MAG: exodeoxyribonuclease VII small subunit [Ruminococcaceae bacterium]|nr:exodeoxyribonuclease VII small subunit [Oscillospiraceae bacterium]